VGRSQSNAGKNREAETRVGEQTRDWTEGIQSPSRVLGGDLEPATHVPAWLLLLLSWLPRVHLPGCTDPSAQVLDHHTTALSAPRKLLKRLGSEGRWRLLARDVVPAIDLLVSAWRDDSELGHSGRERKAAACLLVWRSVVGSMSVLALALPTLPFVPVPVPVPFVRVKP